MLLRRSFMVLTLLIAAGCTQESPPTFIDVVWKTQSSTDTPGSLYVFLSEGTLVITRQGDIPMTGKWTRNATDITMIEEGLSYRTEVLKVTRDTLHIRSHNPGAPVDIHLVRAEAAPK